MPDPYLVSSKEVGYPVMSVIAENESGLRAVKPGDFLAFGREVHCQMKGMATSVRILAHFLFIACHTFPAEKVLSTFLKKVDISIGKAGKVLSQADQILAKKPDRSGVFTLGCDIDLPVERILPDPWLLR